MPWFVRSTAINIYGLKRNSWRHNHHTDKLVEEAAARELFTPSEWKAYQDNQLDLLLNRAATKVPYYKEYWLKQRRSGDRKSCQYLENWPVTTKEVVRNNNLAFIAEDFLPRKMYHEQTSGTTGKPIHVYWSKGTTLQYYAIFERRIRNWHGVNRFDRYAILGGQLVIPFRQQEPPYWVRNYAMNQLYMSSYHLSKTTIEHYIKALNDFKPSYIFGYASSLYSIAFLAREAGLKAPTLQAVISNAEPLYDHQAQLIADYFGCGLVNTYGMSELVAGACSKEDYRELLLWPEVGYLETLDFSADTPTDELGRIIGTSLINQDFCLIRYEVGDAGILSHPSGTDSMVKLRQLEGRLDDLIITRDGRRIGRLDPVFKADFNLIEAQIIQETLERFTINVVPTSSYSTHDEKRIIEALKERVGDVNVAIQKVPSIPKSASGKFKAVVSKIGK